MLGTADRIANYGRALDFAQHQVRSLVARDPDFFAMYTRGGRWRHSGEPWTDWCGGFLAGMMWLFHQRTQDAWWRVQAEHYSRLLEHRKHDRHVHDLGFIFLNTYRRWYETTGDSSPMDVVAEAGVTLAGRFQEKGQYLASFLGPQSLFIDIMMNVPLLFVAADWLDDRAAAKSLDERAAATVSSPLPSGERGGGEGSPGSATANELRPAELRRIALAHCRTSQQYLVRADGSIAHEAIFDPATGQFLRASTQQGLRPDSCWSRGLAWALYGFGTVFGHTRDRQFLQTACRCADYFLSRLPPGNVPYWDFDVSADPDRVWDSSAAAIAAAGLLQLAELTDDANPRSRYRAAALEMLDALCSDQFLAASVPGWEGILLHAVYHYHKKLGVDESVMWGGHFFVEALVSALAIVGRAG